MENITTNIDEILYNAENSIETNDLTSAVKLYKQALEIEPANIAALISISHCLLNMKLKKEAGKYARKAYELYEEDDDMAAVNYSCILSDNNELDKAIRILEKERSKHSTNALVYNNLGYYYFLTENYEKALRNYNVSIIMKEENPLAYCNRGNLKYFIFNDEDGIKDLEKANLYGDFEAGMILQNIIKEKYLLS